MSHKDGPVINHSDSFNAIRSLQIPKDEIMPSKIMHFCPFEILSQMDQAEFSRHHPCPALLHWGTKEREAAAKLFLILTSLGDARVVRENVKFNPAVFWSGLVY